MAASKTLTGSQVLTAPAFDPIGAYAPTLQTLILSPTAASRIVQDALINTKDSIVYDKWSKSAPFDPAAPQINLSFSSNTGATLSTTRNSEHSSMDLKSGDKRVIFSASTETSGDNIFNNDGTYKSEGSFVTKQKISFNDNYGLDPTTGDETTAYMDVTYTQTPTIVNGQTNLTIKSQGSATYFSKGIFSYFLGQVTNEFSIKGLGSNSVWTPQETDTVFSDYKYGTGPTGFNLSFSGTSNTNFDKQTASYDLNNVNYFDSQTRSKTVSGQAQFTLSKIDLNDINLGLDANSDISEVESFVDTYLLPSIRDSGVIVSSVDDLGSILVGGKKKDLFTGGNGNDSVFGSGGNDAIDGGAGTDIAKYVGKYKDYQIIVTNGVVIVSDNVANRDGVDTLENIERIQFADKTVAYDAILGKIVNFTAKSSVSLEQDTPKKLIPLSSSAYDATGTNNESSHAGVTNDFSIVEATTPTFVDAAMKLVGFIDHVILA